jgi:hypothetical protein
MGINNPFNTEGMLANFLQKKFNFNQLLGGGDENSSDQNYGNLSPNSVNSQQSSQYTSQKYSR